MTSEAPRRQRADARRNVDALLDAATAVFGESGVDAPVREIATRAGVGVGTVYRHYPKRSDLVAAVFRHQVDACAEAAPVLAAEYGPAEALGRWLGRFVDFLATKRGLAAALHSGDPAFDALPAYFDERFHPALAGLLDAAVAAGEVRDDVPAVDLLLAVAHLCLPAEGVGPDHARRMTAVLVRGLRLVSPIGVLP
ncbi:TetR/AcrR family transcriptional regulator [Actinomycetospora atypica]|uniref:TetR/AcrR family transcriptional regulator n=1 Tax=Actinomycetospora atypica TaxID=1290095 RepID=A0ABV9YP98_9PSEU